VKLVDTANEVIRQKTKLRAQRSMLLWMY